MWYMLIVAFAIRRLYTTLRPKKHHEPRLLKRIEILALPPPPENSSLPDTYVLTEDWNLVKRFDPLNVDHWKRPPRPDVIPMPVPGPGTKVSR